MGLVVVYISLPDPGLKQKDLSQMLLDSWLQRLCTAEPQLEQMRVPM